MKMTWREYVYNTIEAISIVALWIVRMIIVAGFGLLALTVLQIVKLLFF